MAPPATFVDSMALQEAMISSPPDIKPTSSDINDAAPTGGRRVFKSTSITGHFLVGGKPKIPFIYTVEILRQGKTYCTRYVQVRQPSPTDPRPLDSEVIFVATVSFKTVEPRGLESQVPPPRELKQWVSNPKGCEIAPAVDVPSWIEFTKLKGIRPSYTAVDLRKVDVEEENKSRPLHEHRKYASDRNGIFAVTGPHNASDNIIQTSSLSHTLVFHANPNKLLFNTNEEGEDSQSWAVLEQVGDSASEGRGFIRSRIWNADGALLATVTQDAQIRVRVDNGDKSVGKIDKRKPTFSESLKSML